MSALDQLAGAHALFLNWRDPRHPQAGGAEVYCHEIARRWVAAGIRVTLLTARFGGAAGWETLDGVEIRRAGGTFGVYAAAAHHLRTHRHEYDLVVDFQNGIPFFSPLFAGQWTPCVCVIHHVHQDQFDLRFHWPMNTIGRSLEKPVSRWVYRGRPVIAVSPSTREQIRRRLGFTNPVHLVPSGSSPPLAGLPPRSAAPRIAVVSRLVPHKRMALLLDAVPAVLRHWPDLRIDIAGDGSELPSLRKQAAALGLGLSTILHGRVSEEQKCALLAQAWLTVLPSSGEGWGLGVIEANSVGTPALAFDVPGLRDAVEPGRTGWLLPPGADLAAGIDHALEDCANPGVARRLAEECHTWAAGFSWDSSALRLAEVVLAESRRTQRHRHSRRSPCDLAVVADFEAVDGDALERLMGSALRRTDSWIRAGDRFRVLLDSCDEVRALRVLNRLGVRNATVTLAGRADLLHRLDQGRSWPAPGLPT
ncbi:glycosyltransferase family 4 protein [Phaeacidiphilus oryzae]|jgi:glycosyltransferase involved in cell wall biosynthesis|uniref:glycosyltransferase family 4 protein n=1 Tax=Phaeacidiphilus oryzae TaxID=348818 RepID=UPI0007C7CB1A|nr:glycosyltransferase family 4 protein [Phaeacidiphilus oryzae]